MLPILDTDLMREADRHTIEDLGVPGIVLMENAATGVVEAIRDSFQGAGSVLVLCGRGNNGGDGLAVARHLHNGGHRVEAVVMAADDRLSGDAATNLDVCRAMGVPLTTVPDDDLSPITELLERPPDLVVDALLGTGLDRPLGGRIADVVRLVENAGVPVVAVDVPTGLSGSSATVPGLVLAADLTVTFGALKRCHALPPACLECGDLAVVDIGIPPGTLAGDCDLWWVESDDVALLRPTRPVDGHKGTFGHLLLVGGGAAGVGSIAMGARAAVVLGAGLVTMAVPAATAPTADGACLEAMVHALPEGDDDGLDELLGRVSALAVGPGLGTGDRAATLLDRVLERWHGPLLLDADALNLSAGRLERFEGRSSPTVLTPHPGELARLLGVDTDEVVRDRLAAARAAASTARAVVVAKGYRTVVASPDGDAWVIPVGDSRLASGGAGDVLTGAVGALLAQGAEPERAAIVGCWLHGRAGEFLADDYPVAAPASRVADALGAAWLELDDDEPRP